MIISEEHNCKAENDYAVYRKKFLAVFVFLDFEQLLDELHSGLG